jgi:putative transposase
MSHIKVWVHYVWSTKQRTPFLTDEIRPILFDHIITYHKANNIDIICLNGYVDHVHCLVKLNANQKIMDIPRLIKGESSNWINKEGLIKDGLFQWQQKYFAESIGRFGLPRLKNYIENQETHHRNQTLEAEWEMIEDDLTSGI